MEKIGSGMEKIWIWDKHSGSATMEFLAFFRNHAALHIIAGSKNSRGYDFDASD
jgi:hypothetical protein